MDVDLLEKGVKVFSQGELYGLCVRGVLKALPATADGWTLQQSPRFLQFVTLQVTQWSLTFVYRLMGTCLVM